MLTLNQYIHPVLKDHNTKKARSQIPELSRPNRHYKEAIHEKTKKPQGRKQIHQPKEAIYHNWHTPFLWSQITLAAKDHNVGRSMSSFLIVKVLQKKDPTTFSGIARSTVKGWIDRSGPTPCWSEKALKLAEAGNHQAHPNGGQRGALVSTAY